MKVFKLEFPVLGNPFKAPSGSWKINTYMEHLVELPSGQRVFMSDKELKALEEEQKSEKK